MAKTTPQEYADKWSRRLKAATPDIQRGITRVTTAPGVAAAAAAPRMLEKLTAAVMDGTWAKQVGGVTLEDWKAAFLNKGVQRIAAGVDSATPAQQEMATRLLAAVDASVAEVNRTPRGDLETNIGRAATYAREMSKRKLRRPGGR